MRKPSQTIEVSTLKMNGRGLDYPALQTYSKYSPEKIKALCNLNANEYDDFDQLILMPSWDTLSPFSQLSYRLEAYWTERGATKPREAAMWHRGLIVQSKNVEQNYDKINFGFGGFKNLQDFEKEYVPADAKNEVLNKPIGLPLQIGLAKDISIPTQLPIPDARLIVDRCPQMAMIHALRGDVSEPYWWAVLSITEHATPNLSRDCSDGYPGFTDKELAYRVSRIHNEGTKPALCERLDSVNRGTCGLCRFKGIIRSPIALGYENEPKSKKEVAR